MWINDEVRAKLAAHTAATEARLSETQAENEELRAKLAELRAEQAALRVKLAEQRAEQAAELAAHTAQLADIHASTSWRLSAPVRLAGREAGRLSQRVRRGRAPRLAGGRTDSQSDPPPPAAETGQVAEPEPGPSDPPSPAAEAGQPASGQSDPLLLAAEAGRLEYRPLISILVPVYDTAPRYLRLAVDSVLAQAYPEWELILCDDGSTNAETAAALEEIAELDARIRVRYLGVNQGIAAATNAALAMARGEFVTMLDHDDEVLPAALLEVAKALNADRTLDVVYSDQDYVEANGLSLIHI